jgi:hypothetical protein
MQKIPRTRWHWVPSKICLNGMTIALASHGVSREEF